MAHRGGIPSSPVWAASTYANAGNSATARAGLAQAIEDFLDPFDGPRWRVESAAELLDRVQTPALCIGGLYDIFTASTVSAFRSLSVPSRLVLGPWGHETEVSDAERAEVSRWLGYWLRDEGNDPTAPGARVRVYRSGDDEWRDLGEWPSVEEVGWAIWTPLTSAILLPVNALLDAAPPPMSTSHTDPAIDVGLDSGMRTWSEQWTARTSFGNEPTVLLGSVMLDAWFISPTGSEIDVHCRLSLVRANGDIEQLAESRLRSSHRLVDRSRSIVRSDGELILPWRPHQTLAPVTPGDQFELEIAFPPIHLSVGPGEALQLGLTIVEPANYGASDGVELLPSTRVLLPRTPRRATIPEFSS